MKVRVVFVLLCLFYVEGYTQNRYFNLDSCIQYALRHRPEIRISENSGRQITLETDYLRKRQLPDLNASYAHQFSWGRSLNMEKYEWEDDKNRFGSMSLSSGITLFAGLKLRYQLQAAKLSLERNNSAHQKLQNDIRLEVIQCYYELQAAQATLELYRLFYDKDCNWEERMKVLYCAGRLAEPDWEDCRTQTLKSVTALRNAEKLYSIALLKLKKNIHYTSADSLILLSSDQQKPVWIPSVEMMYSQAISSLPEIRLRKCDSLLLDNRARQLRSNFYPVLSLSGTLYSRYQNNATDPFKDSGYSPWKQIRDNNYKQVGISLSLPLFNRGEVRYNIRLLEIEKMNLKISADKLLADIRYEIEQIWLEAQTRKQNCELLEKQEQSFYKIYHLRQVQYEKHKLTLYDLFIAESNWKNARQELLIERFNLDCYLEMINFYLNNNPNLR